MTRMTETLPDLTFRYSTLPGRIVKQSIFIIQNQTLLWQSLQKTHQVVRKSGTKLHRFVMLT